MVSSFKHTLIFQSRRKSFTGIYFNTNNCNTLQDIDEVRLLQTLELIKQNENKRLSSKSAEIWWTYLHDFNYL